MQKKLIVIMFALVFMFSATAFAGAKEDAQAQMDHMKAAFKHMKENLAPLLNCYVKNQPRLQKINFDYPVLGKEPIAAMSVCINTYGKSIEGEPKADEIKDKVVAALNKDISLGEKFVAKLDEYKNAMEKWHKTNKDRDKLDADAIKSPIEQMKQELFKNANDFQIVVQEFNSYKNDLMDRYKKAQSDLSSAK